jgi:hypothetical protein
MTWVDASYDERLGEVLRPLTHDKSSIRSASRCSATRAQLIAEAFYLNKSR